MENAEFKKIVRNTLTEAGFEYRNKNYYCSTNVEGVQINDSAIYVFFVR